jgi:uncharacterized protein
MRVRRPIGSSRSTGLVSDFRLRQQRLDLCPHREQTLLKLLELIVGQMCHPYAPSLPIAPKVNRSSILNTRGRRQCTVWAAGDHRRPAMDEQRELSWEDVEALATALADELRHRPFDLILGVLRGGLVPACLVSRLLGVRTVLAASAASYADDAKVSGMPPRLVQFPPTELLAGKQVLVVDDIWDSGRTAMAVRGAVERAGGLPTVAVLHYKPAASLFPGGGPDAFGATVDVWIAYPWERVSAPARR